LAPLGPASIYKKTMKIIYYKIFFELFCPAGAMNLPIICLRMFDPSGVGINLWNNMKKTTTNSTKLFCPAGTINTSVISAKDVWPLWGRVLINDSHIIKKTIIKYAPTYLTAMRLISAKNNYCVVPLRTI